MYDIQIISAPSILGLKPSGVEDLGTCFLDYGLKEKLQSQHPVVTVPALNHLYSNIREVDTNCLNSTPIRNFSSTLFDHISVTIKNNLFAFVLGGDCSILLGIMPALKGMGKPGLIFIDAHADFYEAAQSVTGEVADMDLAIVTGRGPEVLTNIKNLGPFVEDENVVHLGQRDQEETRKYGSRDIRESGIKCFSLAEIETAGIREVTREVVGHLQRPGQDRTWVHFDTDVLSDEINPAVDYRLPGGLGFEAAEYLLREVLATGKIAGISITIFNPKLDKDGKAGQNIVECLGRSFDFN